MFNKKEIKINRLERRIKILNALVDAQAQLIKQLEDRANDR